MGATQIRGGSASDDQLSRRDPRRARPRISVRSRNLFLPSRGSERRRLREPIAAAACLPLSPLPLPGPSSSWRLTPCAERAQYTTVGTVYALPHFRPCLWCLCHAPTEAWPLSCQPARAGAFARSISASGPAVNPVQSAWRSRWSVNDRRTHRGRRQHRGGALTSSYGDHEKSPPTRTHKQAAPVSRTGPPHPQSPLTRNPPSPNSSPSPHTFYTHAPCASQHSSTHPPTRTPPPHTH